VNCLRESGVGGQIAPPVLVHRLPRRQNSTRVRVIGRVNRRGRSASVGSKQLVNGPLPAWLDLGITLPFGSCGLPQLDHRQVPPSAEVANDQRETRARVSPRPCLRRCARRSLFIARMKRSTTACRRHQSVERRDQCRFRFRTMTFKLENLHPRSASFPLPGSDSARMAFLVGTGLHARGLNRRPAARSRAQMDQPQPIEVP
jgi:hypothetical protein